MKTGRLTVYALDIQLSTAPQEARAGIAVREVDLSVADAMRRAKGNRQLAAQLLGISRTTLWRRLRDVA